MIVQLDNRTGYDVDVALLGQVLVALEISLPVRASFFKLGIVRHPI